MRAVPARPLHRSRAPAGPAGASTVRVHVAPAAELASVDAERVGVPQVVGHLRTLEGGSDTPAWLPNRQPVSAEDDAMARLGPRPGSTAKKYPDGSWSTTVTMPAAFRHEIRAKAAEQGLSCSDVVANAVAEMLGREQVMAPRNVAGDQGELLAS